MRSNHQAVKGPTFLVEASRQLVCPRIMAQTCPELGECQSFSSFEMANTDKNACDSFSDLQTQLICISRQLQMHDDVAGSIACLHGIYHCFQHNRI